MTDLHGQPDEAFYLLATRQLAGDLSVAEETRLFEQLSVSEACRDVLADIALQARLILAASGRLSAYPGDILQPQRPVAVLRFLGRVIESARRPVVWSVLAASVLYAAYIVGLSWNMLEDKARDLRLEARGEGAPQASSLESQASDLAPAYVVASENAKWQKQPQAGPPAASAVNQRAIEKGEELELASGVVELKLKQGVTLLVEGPAEWSIDGQNNATLKRGKLVANVPKQAIGFTVTTPTAKIVDLGTEFGVEVSDRGETKTEIHVLQGKVEAESIGTSGVREVLLQNGQAASIASGRIIEFDSSVAQRASFVRSLSNSAETVGRTPRNVAHWKPVTASSVYKDTVNLGEIFHIENVVDGRVDDIGGPQAWSFWLAADRQPAEFTIDLQEVFWIGEIRLQNTHNRDHNDRGTREYRLSCSLDGIAFAPINSGVLADVAGHKTIDWVTIPLESPIQARYVRFEALGFYGKGAGLSEIQVFGTPSQATKETK